MRKIFEILLCVAVFRVVRPDYFYFFNLFMYTLTFHETTSRARNRHKSVEMNPVIMETFLASSLLIIIFSFWCRIF